MIKAAVKKHILKFKFDAGTSRGVLKEKETWYISLYDKDCPEIKGTGEAGPLKGLSPDDIPDFENALEELLVPEKISSLYHTDFHEFPSVKFALETALADLRNGGKKCVFRNSFYEEQAAIPINGLIWMGNKESMLRQASEKIKQGFTCLKLKVGALDFESELKIIEEIRNSSDKEIVIRLDANGAFDKRDVFSKLEKLARFNIHSIEQPVKQGQHELIAKVCLESPIPVALDEELIGVYGHQKKNLLEDIMPTFIILKPTLLGGFRECDEWIELAEKQKTGWWITSALESNIGLNAIAQYTFGKIGHMENKPLQGLGTGSLYTNNIGSPLRIESGMLLYDKTADWEQF